MSPAARSLKWLLVYLAERIVIPIRGGPLRGRWWSVSSGSKFLKGCYEPERTAVFERLLRPGQVVWDVGAHMGYYTLIASQGTEPGGRVFSFEALPFNLRQLRRHVRLNRRANVTIFATSVAERSGEGRFRCDRGSATGHLVTEGGNPVRMMALDDLVRAGEIPPPDLIKMDIEGSELRALRGAEATIRSARPVLLLSAHGEALERECRDWLEARGYATRRLEAPGSADTEILAEPGPTGVTE